MRGDLKFLTVLLPSVLLSLGACGTETGNPEQPKKPPASTIDLELAASVAGAQVDETFFVASLDFNGTSAVGLNLADPTVVKKCKAAGDTATVTTTISGNTTKETPSPATDDDAVTVFKKTWETLTTATWGGDDPIGCNSAKTGALVNFGANTGITLRSTFERSINQGTSVVRGDETKKKTAMTLTASGTRDVSFAVEGYNPPLATRHKIKTISTTLDRERRKENFETTVVEVVKISVATVEDQPMVVDATSNADGDELARLIKSGALKSTARDQPTITTIYTDVATNDPTQCIPDSGKVTGSAEDESGSVDFEVTFADGEATITFATGEAFPYALSVCD